MMPETHKSGIQEVPPQHFRQLANLAKLSLVDGKIGTTAGESMTFKKLGNMFQQDQN